MATLFTQIIKGEIPAELILEDEQFYSFLDINPINPGHTLVIPKLEEDYLFSLEDPILAGLLPFAKKIVTAIESVIPCKRIGVMVAGLEVPHAHIHLIPMVNEGDLSFSRSKKAVPSELITIAKKIREAL